LQLLKTKQLRLKDLYAAKAIALQDLENISYEIRGLREEIKNNRTTIVEYKGQIEALKNDMVNINQNYQDGNNDNFIQLRESLNQVQTEINEWKIKYLLPAPVDGNISFYNFLKENQFYQKGAELMSIVPPGTDSIMGLVYLPSPMGC